MTSPWYITIEADRVTPSVVTEHMARRFKSFVTLDASTSGQYLWELVMGKRKCRVCGKVKLLRKFRKHIASKAGRRWTCRACEAEYSLQYDSDHRKERAEYARKYYASHKEKEKERTRKYYEDHREAVLEHGQEYREDHKEKIREYDQKYRKDNVEKIRKRERQYREDHKAELKERRQQYCEDHKKEIRGYDRKRSRDHKEETKERNRKFREVRPEYAQEWCKSNPEKVRGYGRKGARKRTALKLGLQENFTIEEEVFVRSYWDNRCAVCGKTKEEIPKQKRIHPIDHWLPLRPTDGSEGCSLTLNNAVLLCQSHNSKKGNRPTSEVFDAETIKRIEKKLCLQPKFYNKWAEGGRPVETHKDN